MANQAEAVEVLASPSGVMVRFDTTTKSGREALLGVLERLAGVSPEERLHRAVRGAIAGIEACETLIRTAPKGYDTRGLKLVLARHQAVLADAQAKLADRFEAERVAA